MRLQAAYLLLLLPAVLAAKIPKDSSEDFDIDNLSDKWEPVDNDQETDSSTDSKSIKAALEKFIKEKQSSSLASEIPSNSFTSLNSQQFDPNSQFISQQNQQGFVNFNPNVQQPQLSQSNFNFDQVNSAPLTSNTPFVSSQQFNHANVAQILSQQGGQNTPSYSNRPTFNTGVESKQQFSQFNQRINSQLQQGNVAQFLNRDPSGQNQYSAQLSQYAQRQPLNTATPLSANNAALLNSNVPLYLQNQPNFAGQDKKSSDLEGFLKFLQSQETEMGDAAEPPKMEMKEPENKTPPPPPPAPMPPPKPEYPETDLHNPDSFLLKDNAEFTIARDNNGKPILLSDVDANGHIPAHMDYAQYAPAESHQVTYLHASSNGKFENLTNEEQDSKYFQFLNAQSNGQFKNVSSYKPVNSFTPDFTTKQVFPNELPPFEYLDERTTQDILRNTYHPSSSSPPKLTGHFLAKGPSFANLPQNEQRGPTQFESEKTVDSHNREQQGNFNDYSTIPFEFLNEGTNIPNYKDSNSNNGFVPTKDPNIFFKNTASSNDFSSQRYVERIGEKSDALKNNKNTNHFLSKSPLTHTSESPRLDKSEQEGQTLGETLTFRSNNYKVRDKTSATVPYSIKNLEVKSTNLPNLEGYFFQRDDGSFSTVLSEILSTTGSAAFTIPSASTATPIEPNTTQRTILTTSNIRPTTESTKNLPTTNYASTLPPLSTLRSTTSRITDKQTTTPFITTNERLTTQLPQEYFTTQTNSPHNTHYTTIANKPEVDISTIPTTPLPSTRPPKQTQNSETTTQSFTGDGEQGLPSYNPPGLPLQIQGSQLGSYVISGYKPQYLNNNNNNIYSTQSIPVGQHNYNSNFKPVQRPLQDSMIPSKQHRSPPYTNDWLNNNYLYNPYSSFRPASGKPVETQSKPLRDVSVRPGFISLSENYFSHKIQPQLQYQSNPAHFSTSSPRGPNKPDDSFLNYASSTLKSQGLKYFNNYAKNNDVKYYGYANPPSYNFLNRSNLNNIRNDSAQKDNDSKIPNDVEGNKYNKYNNQYDFPNGFGSYATQYAVGTNNYAGQSSHNAFTSQTYNSPSKSNFYPSPINLNAPAEYPIHTQNMPPKYTHFQNYAPSTFNQYQTPSNGHLSISPGLYLQSIQSDSPNPQGSTSQGYLSLPPGLFLQSDTSSNSNQPNPVQLAETQPPSIPSGYYQQVSQNDYSASANVYKPQIQSDVSANQGYPSLPPALYLQGQNDAPEKYNNNHQSYLVPQGVPPGLYLQNSPNNSPEISEDPQIQLKPQQSYAGNIQGLYNNGQFKPSSGTQGAPVLNSPSNQSYVSVSQQVQSDVPKPEGLNGVASFDEEDLTPIHLPADNCTAVFEILEDRQSVLGVKAMPGEADCRLTFVSPSPSRVALQVVGLDLPQGDDACKLASVSVFSQNEGRNLLLNQLCGSVKESPVMLTEGQSALVTVQSEMGTQRPGFTVIAFLW